jgi:hypothetical protein
LQVGNEEELCAEYMYELFIVARGLAAVETADGVLARPAKRAKL